ncbi:MAG: hypothetical protein ACFFE4_20280 [Candidatus Thorarchaeota archaeon]
MKHLSHKEEGLQLKVFMDFDKSNSKIFVDYFVEDFKIEIKTPLKTEDKDKSSVILLNRLDFSNSIFLASIK